MEKKVSPLPIRMFWSVVFFFVRIRYAALAVVLSVAAIAAFQYWQELTRDARDLYKKGNNDILQITMFYPDRLGTGEEDDLEFTVEALGESLRDSQVITVSIDTDDDFAYVNPMVLSFQLNEGEKRSAPETVTLGYRNPISPPPEFNLSANVLSSSGDFSMMAAIRLDSTSKKVLTAVSAVLSGLLAIVNAILQLRELIKPT